MFLELLGFIFLGIGVGILTGLIPGIHVNSVCFILLSSFPLLISDGISSLSIAALVISMAITHTILDFIPSIFLGAPEPSTALSVLPGHKLLLQGKGLEALFLTIMGGIGVVILFVLFLPILIFLLPLLYNSIKFYIHWILLLLVLIMILREPGWKKIIWSILIFFLSGILGLLTLNSILLPSHFLFFPLFTGLFGISTLLVSLKGKSIIPPQEKFFWKIERKLILLGTLKSFFSSLLVGILPGVGAAQATILTQELTRKKEKDPREFLISIGGINTAVAIFSLLSLFVIQKPRSGAAVFISKLLQEFGLNELLLLIACALISVGISSIITLKIAKKTLTLLPKISYHKISLLTIFFLFCLVIFLTGKFGLLILLTSTSIGLIAPLTGTRRSHAMGVLLLPVILFYAGLTI